MGWLRRDVPSRTYMSQFADPALIERALSRAAFPGPVPPELTCVNKSRSYAYGPGLFGA